MTDDDARKTNQTNETMNTKDPNFTKVAEALAWAKRSGYADADAAGQAFAALTGTVCTDRDGGLYADDLEFKSQEPVSLDTVKTGEGWNEGKF